MMCPKYLVFQLPDTRVYMKNDKDEECSCIYSCMFVSLLVMIVLKSLMSVYILVLQICLSLYISICVINNNTFYLVTWPKFHCKVT